MSLVTVGCNVVGGLDRQPTMPGYAPLLGINSPMILRHMEHLLADSMAGSSADICTRAHR